MPNEPGEVAIEAVGEQFPPEAVTPSTVTVIGSEPPFLASSQVCLTASPDKCFFNEYYIVRYIFYGIVYRTKPGYTRTYPRHHLLISTCHCPSPTLPLFPLPQRVTSTFHATRPLHPCPLHEPHPVCTCQPPRRRFERELRSTTALSENCKL